MQNEPLIESTTARLMCAYGALMIEAIYKPTDSPHDIDDELQLFSVMYYSDLEEREPECMVKLMRAMKHIMKRTPFTYDSGEVFAVILERGLLNDYYEWRDQHEQILTVLAGIEAA